MMDGVIGTSGEGEAEGLPEKPAEASMSLPLLLLWIARYYLVLCAGGIYAAFMLIEYDLQFLSSITRLGMQREVITAGEQTVRFLLEVIQFCLWMFGSFAIWLALRLYRWRLERRLSHVTRA